MLNKGLCQNYSLSKIPVGRACMRTASGRNAKPIIRALVRGTEVNAGEFFATLK